MSIFTKLKLSKKAAKEHKQHEQEAAQKEDAPVKTPYRHIPTHAAVDALSGAPSSWKHDDRSKIKAEHSRRSLMSMSRSTSVLSGPAASGSASPVLPRNISYSSYSQSGWERSDAENVRSAYIGQVGQRMPRSRSYMGIDSGLSSMQASPISTELATPAESSATSAASVASSSDRFPEMKSEHSFSHNDIFERLHLNKERKLGEAPILDAIPARPMLVDIKPVSTKRGMSWISKGKMRQEAVAVAVEV